VAPLKIVEQGEKGLPKAGAEIQKGEIVRGLASNPYGIRLSSPHLF
jgi:hypothetical protein